jgi:hypothetical protein
MKDMAKSLHRAMDKLSRSRGAPARPSLAKRRHVKREAGWSKAKARGGASISPFAMPASPNQKSSQK